MQTEVTLQLVFTINSSDEDDYDSQLQARITDLEDRGYDVDVEEEDRLDDVYDLLDDEDDVYGYEDDNDEW